ncbi:MAG: hypothetical protein PG978_000254 [Wolbachia endosymbiont of Ctenocephalides felis wCfeF]|nr:MAG: hypothetical protein PG978_000254 [Wolbachia endosymbiont of Ctenocephalides felis wCfeF]
MVSFQRVTLESGNFIRLVSIKVMLRRTIFMENWIPATNRQSLLNPERNSTTSVFSSLEV